MTIPNKAISENQAMLVCPPVTITNTAIKGPMALPVCPPTTKTAWAKPSCPPEARRASRVASGWKIEEPIPTMAEPTSRKV